MTNSISKTVCACCGMEILPQETEPMFHYPDEFYHHLQAKTVPAEARVSDDLIAWDDHYYIRGLLPISVEGRDKHFNIGMWAKVGFSDFHTYIKNFNSSGKYEFSGELANKLPNHPESVGVKVRIQTQGAEDRPLFIVLDKDSSLSKVQETGIKEHDIRSFFP